jgi:hypothetical protein
MELSILAGGDEVATVDAIMSIYAHGGTVIEEVPSSNSRQISLIKAYLPSGRSFRTQRIHIEQAFEKAGKSISTLKERELDPGEWLNSLKRHFPAAEVGG